MPGILDTVRCNNTFGALVPLPYIFIIFYAFPKSPLLVGCIIDYIYYCHFVNYFTGTPRRLRTYR